MTPLRGLCIGAGYFSRFHLDAWNRLPDVEVVGICDLDPRRAQSAAGSQGIDSWFTEPAQAIEQLKPDFVDLITPPETHLDLIALAAQRQIPIICQKPLAHDLPTARTIVELCERANCPLMVHENFRFQPWHREIKRLIDRETIGTLHSIRVITRLGDGWAEDAYLDRQPYFRTMPRLLVFETGVHFLDTFTYLGGEIIEIYAKLRRLNPKIQGEDVGTLQVIFRSGAMATWDASRYNEPTSENAHSRYTFGTFLIEGTNGSIQLELNGQMVIKTLGQPSRIHPYAHQPIGFAGDCVLATQQHFLQRLRSGSEFETSGRAYLQIMKLMESAYRSNDLGHPVNVDSSQQTERSLQREDQAGDRTISPSPALLPGHRILDLSVPIDASVPGFTIAPAKRLDVDGWNATTLSLYSHCGTHMDAPRHFLPGGRTIDQQDLSICLGPAKIINLAPVQAHEFLTIERLGDGLEIIEPGDRILLRTDWSHRRGTPEYREALPRISEDLADWLVRRGVRLIGVEPPSIANVNDLGELTRIHQILLEGGVTIVEGLHGLDRIPDRECQLVVLPLAIVGGDGCPVRALALIPEGGGARKP